MDDWSPFNSATVRFILEQTSGFEILAVISLGESNQGSPITIWSQLGCGRVLLEAEAVDFHAADQQGSTRAVEAQNHIRILSPPHLLHLCTAAIDFTKR